MEMKPVRTEADYEAAVRRIDSLWGAPQGTADGDEFDALMTLMEAYEREHYPIEVVASRWLARWGGTMPKLKSIPRRRSIRV
jgi:antitoxin component HigA of HigAB toxin-antitoxin module